MQTTTSTATTTATTTAVPVVNADAEPREMHYIIVMFGDELRKRRLLENERERARLYQQRRHEEAAARGEDGLLGAIGAMVRAWF